MKKIAAIIACLAVCLSLAACSGGDAESSSPVTENSSATPVSSQTAPESTTAATGSGTIEAYIASIQDTIDQMSESMKAQGMNIKVLARDKSLVYSYQLTTESADISQICLLYTSRPRRSKGWQSFCPTGRLFSKTGRKYRSRPPRSVWATWCWYAPAAKSPWTGPSCSERRRWTRPCSPGKAFQWGNKPGIPCRGEPSAGMGCCTLRPVSYTHLDVYKRQM